MPCAHVNSNVKDGITDEELLRLPHDSALQRMVQRIQKPVGASSVDRPTREILEYLKATQSHLARFSYAQEQVGNTNLTDDEYSSDENDDDED
uniref:Uncharacterized protein n=1 Tax=Ditylenchus dipsaci TaxID=166011 RepID=A0A915DLU4_9BILA